MIFRHFKIPTLYIVLSRIVFDRKRCSTSIGSTTISGTLIIGRHDGIGVSTPNGAP